MGLVSAQPVKHLARRDLTLASVSHSRATPANRHGSPARGGARRPRRRARSTTRSPPRRTAHRSARRGYTTSTRSSAAAAAGPPGAPRATRDTAARSATSTAQTRVRSGIRPHGSTGVRARERLRGSPEAHAGFKVFVANEDHKGLAWIIVLHQGSGSPRRGSVRFHWLEPGFSASAAAECWRERARWRTWRCGGELPGGGDPRGVAPAAGAGLRPSYEEWATALDLGGVFRAAPPSASTTRSRSSTLPTRAHGLQQAGGLRRADRRGGNRAARATAAACSTRAGSCATTAPRASAPTPTGGGRIAGLLQIVSRRIRVDQRRERDGVENAFIAEQPSDGGIFRAGRGWRPKKGFEFPGYCVLRSN